MKNLKEKYENKDISGENLFCYWFALVWPLHWFLQVTMTNVTSITITPGHNYRISSKSRRGEIQLYQAATIQGWLDFEGGVYRDRYTHTFKSKPICMHV